MIYFIVLYIFALITPLIILSLIAYFLKGRYQLVLASASIWVSYPIFYPIPPLGLMLPIAYIVGMPEVSGKIFYANATGLSNLFFFPCWVLLNIAIIRKLRRRRKARAEDV